MQIYSNRILWLPVWYRKSQPCLDPVPVVRYIPLALTDFILMSEDSSYMFVTGPKVVKTVTGEEVTQNELGGSNVHASKSGVAHFVAVDEYEGISMIRKLLSYLPQNNLEEPPVTTNDDQENQKAIDEMIKWKIKL